MISKRTAFDAGSDKWSKEATSVLVLNAYRSRTEFKTTKCECLSVVLADPLRPYLEQKIFIISTDHDAHKCILNVADWTEQLARWRPSLSKFDFDVVHTRGVKNEATDALSRIETKGTDYTLLHDIPEVMVSLVQNTITTNSMAVGCKILWVWKLPRHCRRTTERFDRSNRNRASEHYSYGDRKKSDSGGIL